MNKIDNWLKLFCLGLRYRVARRLSSYLYILSELYSSLMSRKIMVFVNYASIMLF